MLSSIFVALLQTAAGDPAVAATTEQAAAEAPAAAADAAPRTERRRVCRGNEAATGGRLAVRRCRWEEVPIRDAETAAADASEETIAAPDDATTEAEAPDAEAGGVSPAASPAPPSPQ
jgi:hypothetical protein